MRRMIILQGGFEAGPIPRPVQSQKGEEGHVVVAQKRGRECDDVVSLSETWSPGGGEIGREVGNHRPVARFPDDQLHRLPSLHGDGFGSHFERARSAGCVVVVRIAFAYALDEEILKVAAGIGYAPGDGAVMAQKENGSPRNSRARKAEPRRFHAREIPEPGRRQPQMGIAGQ